jgi:hypothetical protein
MPNKRYFRVLETQDVRQDIDDAYREAFRAFDLHEPVAVAGRFPVLTLECEPIRPMPDFFRSGPNAIVSERFRKVCAEFQVPAEFLPIHVNHRGQYAPGSPFWFVHLLERLDCIDQERSDFEAWSARPESEFRRLNKLEFRQEAIGNRDLFRPKRYSQLFVSDELRRALLQADCLVRFTALEKVRL